MTRDIELKPASGEPVPLAPAWSYRPPVDVLEDAEGCTVLVDLPGTTGDGITIRHEPRRLHVHATVAPRQPHATNHLAHEYGVGDFDREIPLPEEADPDRITAEYHHGVLKIRLPRTAASRPRRIPVRTR
ncbi:MAG: Hsp20/alpha crystallin family protein [Planctomycetota bacterium]|jgi:HSP20 family molecular chaperone IbpA